MSSHEVSPVFIVLEMNLRFLGLVGIWVRTNLDGLEDEDIYDVTLGRSDDWSASCSGGASALGTAVSDASGRFHASIRSSSAIVEAEEICVFCIRLCS